MPVEKLGLARLIMLSFIPLSVPLKSAKNNILKRAAEYLSSALKDVENGV